MMPEPRDRLQRPADIAAEFFRRRSQFRGVYIDEPETSPSLYGSPVPRAPAAATGAVARVQLGGGSVMRGGGLARGSSAISRFGSVRARNPPLGRENTPVGSARRVRARGMSTVLPSWYPRTPLRDITAIVRAIERRRARLGEVDGRELESPNPQQGRVLDSPVPLSGAHLEHNSSMVTPKPAVGIKRCLPSTGKVHKILLDITNQNAEEGEFLTPQKKLLNSIDKVEKVVMEELQRLKKTPSAKKAEREKKVRTLMSMR